MRSFPHSCCQRWPVLQGNHCFLLHSTSNYFSSSLPAISPRIEQKDQEGYLSHLIPGRCHYNYQVWMFQPQREKRRNKTSLGTPLHTLLPTCLCWHPSPSRPHCPPRPSAGLPTSPDGAEEKASSPLAFPFLSVQFPCSQCQPAGLHVGHEGPTEQRGPRHTSSPARTSQPW